MATIPRHKFTIIEQTQCLKSYFPSSSVKISGTGFVWEGVLRPTPLSQEYKIKLNYRKGHHPDIFVVSPKLELPEGKTNLEHVYSTEKQHLCIYHRPSEEWDNTMLIAQTVMPWVSEWITQYENWLITGEWHGGGIEHGVKHVDEKAN